MKKAFVQIECSKLTRFLKDLEGFIEDGNGNEEDEEDNEDEKDEDEKDDDEKDEKDEEDEKNEEDSDSEDYSEDDNDVEEFIIGWILLNIGTMLEILHYLVM